MPNALAGESSPYLRQHADNPVDWLPWGEAAFARARAEDRPIFLSIGYSTCHWCHVMAHESFEHPDIAAFLNAHFVSIKLDREERPDVDRVYMAYVQALTGHGGWPLSAWLTPDLKPFYAGTYFPPSDRGGRAGLPSVLRAIARGWREDRATLLAEADRVVATLRAQAAGDLDAGAEGAGAEGEGAAGQDAGSGDGEGGRGTAGGGGSSAGARPGRARDGAPPAPLFEAAGAAFEKGMDYYASLFDSAHGGFGGAPKFPRPANLSFLIRCAALQGPDTEVGREAIGMVDATLRAMATGGIHDHVGGGFHRYAVDAAWFVPHFEKMLYDQAQIAVVALDAWRGTGDERHAWLARDILDYVLRDLAAPGGGFHSAEDADSEMPAGLEGPHASHGGGGRVEGAFYVWTHGELEQRLGSDAPLFCAHFGVIPGGNVPADQDPHGEFKGRNILVQTRPLAETAKLFSLGAAEASDRVVACAARLLAVRSERPRPRLDDKVIAAWNGLMISALAQAAVAPAESLGDRRPVYRAAAERAASFVETELRDGGTGVLRRSWRAGAASGPGFAEDHACVIQGLLDLYEATFSVRWLVWAESLQQVMDTRFWDSGAGGYFSSPADAADIVVRLKEDYDGAEPSASSVAALNLLRLSALLGREDLRDRGRRVLAAFRARWEATPHAMPQLLCAVELALEAPRHVVLSGDPESAGFQQLADVIRERVGPRRTLIALDAPGGARSWFANRLPWTVGMGAADPVPRAYVCEEFVCRQPAANPGELRAALAG